jgi:myo-inositol-hexaphosphate 3-phosphohydrolase
MPWVALGLVSAAVAAAVGPRPFPVVPSSVITGTCGSGDSCDDTAIWVHPSAPERSVIIGDDKKGGLLVWSLAGERLQLRRGHGDEQPRPAPRVPARRPVLHR